jgi:hypothetical protein
VPTKTPHHRYNPSPSEQSYERAPQNNAQVSTTTTENQSSNKQQQQQQQPCACSGSGDATGKEPPVDSISLTRQHRWAALLGKRPEASDADCMSAWLLEVMAVSDLKTPLKNAGTSSLTASEPTTSVNSLTSSDGDELLSNDDEDGTSSERHQQRLQRAHHRAKKRSKSKEQQRMISHHAETTKRSSKKRRWVDEPEDSKHKSKKTKSNRKAKHNSKSKREKKKRRSVEDDINSSVEQELSGSYAEWRDRKKQKAMSKKIVMGVVSTSEKNEDDS